jgi:bifunctional DNase/RNase
MLVPFVVTQHSVVAVDDKIIVLLMKAAEVNVPMTISLYEGECIVYLLKDGDLDPRSAAAILKEVLALSGIPVVKIAITELCDDGDGDEPEFAARLFLMKGGEEVSFPIFPGDAILLALALGAPMFIDEEVVMWAIKGEAAQQLLSIVEETAPIALKS